MNKLRDRLNSACPCRRENGRGSDAARTRERSR